MKFYTSNLVNIFQKELFLLSPYFSVNSDLREDNISFSKCCITNKSKAYMYYGHISLESLLKSFDNPSFLHAGYDKNKILQESIKKVYFHSSKANVGKRNHERIKRTGDPRT